ncbi:MAG: endonuclease MutS2 [Lachnospiraceae bacterium]|nr:endonuclease MutS2 [Lachnospiraceae bacterium]
MNSKVLITLEYDKIIKLLADRATSEPGRQKCLELTPLSDHDGINRLQQETFDSTGRLLRNGEVSFGGNKAVEASMMRLEKGSSISTQELMDIAGLLENTARVRSYGHRGDEESKDCLDKMFDALSPLSGISSEIRRCIISCDEIADDASPELKNIRRHIRATQDRIHTRLNSMVNSTYKAYLQDNVVTMREGRYCIPVKAEYKGNVPGMIHDRSSTASTLFIEPSDIVNLNNEIKELQIKEAKEIEVILASLSASCGEHTEEIRLNRILMTELDHIFARGRLALDMKATRPEFNKNRVIDLKKARHPLIDKGKVVPIDIRLGDDFDLLVITGPNTGGKTVALKTLGLLTLMGQAGLQIPALDHSQLSVFDEVFADIGDEQSIEQSLSTFSSHMKTIVNILENADETSLCLFDELGAGTDPVEGAALATAILDRLHQAGIRTAATTHYSELKVYALREDRVCNASCEFNVDTLAPTYRLLIGVPGKSNAFAIAGKLGLPSYIIDSAKERISEADESFEDVLSELEANRVLLEQEKLTIRQYREEADRLRTDYEAKKNKLNEQKERILSEAREEALRILSEAKDSADEAIRNFHKNGSIQSMENERTGLREKIGGIRNDMGKISADKASAGKAKQTGRPVSRDDIKPGATVRIISMDLKGTVSSLPDKKGNLFVQCGIMNIKAGMNDIEFVMPEDNVSSGSGRGYEGSTGKRSGNKKSGSKGGGYGSVYGLSKAGTISVELNLIGCTTDEAIPKLEKYLDDAYLSHLETVRIVHGKGTGALRNAVWNYLKRMKYVKSYKLAEYGEGDAGVTIVTFK